MHARPRSLSRWRPLLNARFFSKKNGHKVNGKSIMGVMMLAASKGTEMILTTEGKGENTASTKLQELIQNRFGEEE